MKVFHEAKYIPVVLSSESRCGSQCALMQSVKVTACSGSYSLSFFTASISGHQRAPFIWLGFWYQKFSVVLLSNWICFTLLINRL